MSTKIKNESYSMYITQKIKKGWNYECYKYYNISVTTSEVIYPKYKVVVSINTRNNRIDFIEEFTTEDDVKTIFNKLIKKYDAVHGSVWDDIKVEQVTDYDKED